MGEPSYAGGGCGDQGVRRLLPVTQMDQGFIFPKYPEQVIVSYWQAGTICDYISERWGNDAILGMVHSFAALKTTPEAIQDNLHESPDQFDKDYAAWLDKSVGATVANFDKWREQLKALVGMSEKNDDDGVIAAASAVIKMYPQYVEDANAYEIVANAQLTKGNKQMAADALTLYELLGGEDPKTLEKLASLEDDLGHPKEAADTLDQLNFIYPEDEDLHRKLGDLWLAQGNNSGAVREYSGCAGDEAVGYGLRALTTWRRRIYAEGDKAKAEEQVLGSLEAAPGFKPAQKLLLEIEGK